MINNNPYDFVKITDLKHLSIDDLYLPEIAESAYVVIAYNGHNYNVSAREFIDIYSYNITKLNDKIDYLVDNSISHARQEDQRLLIPKEQYIHTYYVSQSETPLNEPSEGVLNIDNRNFTIVSYGIYSYLEIDDHSTYSLYSLSNGIVSGEVMNSYMGHSLDSVLGVPGTLAYVTEAIDSISEFAAWFNGVKRESSYNALMDYISTNDSNLRVEFVNADNEIINNYQNADEEIRETIDIKTNLLRETINDIITSYQNADIDIRNQIYNIDNKLNHTITSYQAADNAIITSYKNADNAIITSYKNADNAIINTVNTKQDKLIAGEYISIDENIISSYGGITVNENNNSLDSDGIRYILKIEDNKIGFDIINELVFTLSSNINSNYEYEANTPTEMIITYNTSKESSIYCNMYTENSGYLVSEQNHKNDGTWKVDLNNKGDNSYTLYAYPKDNYSTKHQSISCNFNKYRYWYGIDNNANRASSYIKSNMTNNTSSNGYSTSMIIFNENNWESGKYIYLLLKKKSSGSFTFKIGQGSTAGQLSGGMTLIEDDISNIYNDSTKKYQLWRSTNIMTANCNIVIS